ncbi:MAG: lipid-A-disaccharide synthase N-terminal domain-containing protein [Candidatus Cryptobacteroides sp.]
MLNGVPTWIVFSSGFIAQLLFSLRTLLQWFKSEKARRIESPSAYWILSVAGAYIMFIYGVMRDDFSIILGQLVSYYVYLWNLGAKGIWNRLMTVVKVLLLLTPVLAVGLLFRNAAEYVQSFFHNDSIPLWLVVFGSAGQIIFTLRFVYQYFYSAKRHCSSLPMGFWGISLLGSGVIIAYGIFRLDPVLILGQSFGFIAYVRNLMIGFKEKKQIVTDEQKTANQ